jgi:hypothetical protein
MPGVLVVCALSFGLLISSRLQEPGFVFHCFHQLLAQAKARKMQNDHNGVKKSMLAMLCSCFSSSKTDD